MYKLALIGKDISHSKSKDIYENLLEQKIIYELIDCPNENFLPKLEDLKKYDGVSITSPYKKFYVDKVIVENEVSFLKAINCLSFKDGKFYGTNTDFNALLKILPDYFPLLNTMEVHLFGSGPMAMIVKHLLKLKGIEFFSHSRIENSFLKNLDSPRDKFIFNCLTRNIKLPMTLNSNDVLYDMNYKNEQILENFRSKPKYIDGLTLLEEQAKFALSFWKIKALLNS